MASSVVLVNTQPVFVALMSALFLERANRRQWLGIGVAVTGAAVIGWGDSGPVRRRSTAISWRGRGGLAAGYYVIGRNLRQRLDLWVYIRVVYGVALVLRSQWPPARPRCGVTRPWTGWCSWPWRRVR